METASDPTVLLTGASGYVGSRLLTALVMCGYRVRCLVRNPEAIPRSLLSEVEIFQGDVFDLPALKSALEGMDTAYYLIHSMGSGRDFIQLDRKAAENFSNAASESGVQRIIFLGGLGSEREELSPHLKSRHEVGEILRKSIVQVIELRSSVVIGSGSLSFEMIRALVERLPVMVTPRWVSVLTQPIEAGDLINYLLSCLSLKWEGHAILEVGGADKVSYGDLMQEYGRVRGLRRFMIPVPVLTPHLSSLWLELVTPVYARVGRILIESIKHPTVVHDDTALRVFDIKPKGIKQAIAEALDNEGRELEQTPFSEIIHRPLKKNYWGTVQVGNWIFDSREIQLNVTPEKAFAPIQRIGGRTGWYAWNWLWRLRGWMDECLGGVGMRRGRRHTEDLQVGDFLDCWKVVIFEPGRRLRLLAEMKLPGRAWLEFEIKPTAQGVSLRQTAMFEPRGLCGILYWYLVLPLHHFVFRDMLQGIGNEAIGDRR